MVTQALHFRSFAGNNEKCWISYFQTFLNSQQASKEVEGTSGENLLRQFSRTGTMRKGLGCRWRGSISKFGHFNKSNRKEDSLSGHTCRSLEDTVVGTCSPLPDGFSGTSQVKPSAERKGGEEDWSFEKKRLK